MNLSNITENTPISPELKRRISLDLEQFHSVFDVFWTRLEQIVFVPATSSMKTACVTFFEHARGDMHINAGFWLGLNEDERLFIVLHECMHVLLDHGIRSARGIPGATHHLVNIAQDITINEMIVDMFNFPRGLMREWRNYCWIETCFPDPSVILQNQPFEYYLRELIKNPPPDVSTIDEHTPAGGEHGDPDELAKELAEDLTDEELQALLQKMQQQGGRGIELSPYRVIIARREPPKVNFNTLIDGLKRSKKSRDEKERDSFAREARRYAGLGNLMLPGKLPGKPKNTKLIAALYFDVSGSCMEFMGKFHAAAEAFNNEKNLFDLRLFAFDTTVQEYKIGDRVKVGGGTSFDIIEKKNREIELETGKYPDCVIVLTDGAGNAVNPKYSGRWVWLLTANGTRRYIPFGARVWPITSVIFE